MRLAILGIRGIPAAYGGFETFAEELGPRLASAGHEVTVYGRRHAVDWDKPYYRGVRLVILPTIRTKYLDTPVHTLLCCFHAAFRRYDVVLACNAANAPFLAILRIAGIPVVLNVDGIERLRRKWGVVGRAWYRVGEYLATKIPSVIVSDAGVIEEYYRTRWGTQSTMIPYGASADPVASTRVLEEYGLSPRRYVLVVTRLEPENNADLVVRAFAKVRTDMRLVVVGDAPYAPEYKQMLAQLAAVDPRVLMTGFIYGEGYRELQSHAFCYVQATEVGGTHPALIEGMGLGGCVIANGTPENVEVLGGTGLVFEPGSEASLVSQLQVLVESPALAEALRLGARARVLESYSWEAVTSQYEQLLESLVEDRNRARRSG